MITKYSLPIFSISQTRQIERYLIDEIKISEFQLMTEAGRAVFEVLKQNIANKDISISIFCGSGNNGGDGYIVAGLAKEEGFNIRCFEVGNFEKQSVVSKDAREFALKKCVDFTAYDKNLQIEKNSIVIDAILGIGIKGKVKGLQLDAIKTINNSGSFVIAIDNPSGIDCDSGEVLGDAVKSDVTVTFLTRKQGLFIKYGLKYSGEINFSNLNCSYVDFLKTIPVQYNILQKESLLKIIPERKFDSHKGDYGNILIIGGDYGMGGAVIMTAMAASRAGAGKATVLTRKDHIAPLISRLPNVMTATYKSKDDLQEVIKDKTLIVIGTGLGKSKWSQDLFDFFMKSNLPKVIDADALNMLSKSDVKYDLKNSIITPHPKEAGRLLDITSEAVQANRVLAIKELYKRYRAISVLKGFNSLILGDDEELYICPYGNPSMAVAGMGDILTGLIAGFSTQNINFSEAAILGVYVHAVAGDEIAKKTGEVGMLPVDIIQNINI